MKPFRCTSVLEREKLSIFVSEEAKQKFQGFWFGLGVPIFGGWGISLFSLILLTNRNLGVAGNPYSPMTHIVIILWMSGHLLLWPLLSWLMIRRAKKSGNLHCEKGSRLSLKLSIFVSEEAKQKFQGFWFGLGVPIFGGWGISLFSLILLTNRNLGVAGNPYSPMTHIVIILWMSGHLLLWPLLSWLMIRRAKKSGNLHCEKGSRLSLKLAIAWIAFIVSVGAIQALSGDA